MLNDLFLLGKLTGLGLVILLPLANPLTSMTMLLSLGQHIPARAADPPGGVLCGGHHAGDLLRRGMDHEHLRHLDTRLRIAGGLIVMVLGFSMLFPKAQPEDAPEVEQTDAAAGAAPPQHRLRAAGHAGHGGAGYHRHDHQRGLVDEFR